MSLRADGTMWILKGGCTADPSSEVEINLWEWFRSPNQTRCFKKIKGHRLFHPFCVKRIGKQICFDVADTDNPGKWIRTGCIELSGG